MTKRLAIGAVCALTALVAGCHRGAPQGQVAATLNGEEITLQELNTELQASNVPANMDKQVAQRQALQHVIDRKLLLKAATDKKLDKSPEYRSQKQRADELLLAQTYARQQLNAVPVPSATDISKFMADHPSAFGDRKVLQLDQIRFRPDGGDLKKLAVIQQDHSLEAVGRHLTALGIRFERTKTSLDSVQLPPAMAKAIYALPTGEPFVLPANGFVTVNVLTGQQAVPVDQAQAQQVATNAWRQEQFTKIVGDQLKSLRDGAKITYQSGFAPTADTKVAPGLPAAVK